MIADLEAERCTHRRRKRRIGRGRPSVQDEFTNRTDLTAYQKWQLRHLPNGNRVHSRHSGIQGKGALLAKMERTNLGLALVSLVAKPGVPLIAEDIAAWCDCSTQSIQQIERIALKKLRNALFFRDRGSCEELRASMDLFASRQPARRSTRMAA